MIIDKEQNLEHILKQIGGRITEIRIAKAVSLQELADRCNFEKYNMSRIEYGRTNLTIKTLFKISQALGVALKDIVDVEDIKML